ncbi:DNA ligase [Vibrio sp. SS-MA-C1-2]|uniref:BRCT domain-containing protein n=1 Tax=Vibrio sp. SS-MA-C1-2 TaxID=2908646 RepID=UPI001F35D183|nr:BRCT domain-containing protein [Vibrio sp. SS-MA-C1-2]UJF19802.1 DNA ligase [Vibrio sp. SS-MA-C1-2]
MLNSQQQEIFKQLDPTISETLLIEVTNGNQSFESLDNGQQLAVLKLTNSLYRAGYPLLDDISYDAHQNYFKSNNPDHPFVNQVEDEVIVEGKTVALPVKMLSTDKAYSEKEIQQWIKRIKKAALSLKILERDIELRVTPKLDGYAAYDDGNILYTRGNGLQGRDISFVFNRGLMTAEGNERGLGAGEIVISKSYFAENLAEHFENSRNIQASIIAEKNVDERVQQAVNCGAAVFFPFAKLPNWQGSIADFIANFTSITNDILTSSDYDVDGVIIETTHQAIKEEMGATRHHHRWQIALKSNDEKAEVKILAVIPQTSRNGKITPVAQLEPTRLSGAEITRATAHNYGMVREKGIGKGTIIQLVRSGLVIPKIEKVLKPATPDIPDNCPCCDQPLTWVDDNLFCLNTQGCRDQIEKSIIHFFDTLGNNDGFGPATISILFDHQIRTIADVYQFADDPQQLVEMGYKEKTVNNLVDALNKSRQIEIEDWRFLAAFGVNRLGLGVAEKLLQHHGIEQLFSLSVDDIKVIDGFAEKTALQVVAGLAEIKSQFDAIYGLGFNLQITPNILDSQQLGSVIAGKIVVFTGAMSSGSRGDMEKKAKELGAKVAKSVSGKTHYLITGAKVGANKINAAEAKGVTVISEAQYLEMID